MLYLEKANPESTKSKARNILDSDQCRCSKIRNKVNTEPSATNKCTQLKNHRGSIFERMGWVINQKSFKKYLCNR